MQKKKKTFKQRIYKKYDMTYNDQWIDSRDMLQPKISFLPLFLGFPGTKSMNKQTYGNCGITR